MMFKPRILVWVGILVAAWLAGCGSAATLSAAPSLPSVTPSPVQIVPYHSATPSPRPFAVDAHTQPTTPTPIPSPTPTPRSYTVIRNDDMFGIALRHGIPIEALLTANPTVQPNFLSVGTVLQIPYVPGTPTPGETTPTPVALTPAPPVCYTTADGGAWCYLRVENTYDSGLENLSGQFLISGPDGKLLDQPAVPPLDMIPPGQSMPLAAFFPPPVPQPFAVNGQILTALLQPEDSPRYLPIQVDNFEVEIGEIGRSARAGGQVSLPAESGPASRAAVLAVAYSAEDEVVGVRKLEFTQGLAAGASRSFEVLVYSLGPPIARVEILAEARP